MPKRGKQKVKNHFTVLVGYERYKENEAYPVSSKVYWSIHKEINTAILELLRREAFTYTLPEKLGRLRIKKYKQRLKLTEDGQIEWRGANVDYKKTWDYWRSKWPNLTDEEILQIPPEGRTKIYHTNFHTGGYRYKYFWDKGAATFAGKNCMTFKPVRSASRGLAAFLSSLEAINVDYYE